MRKVDVAIIGAGTAGLSARKEVMKHTSNYVVIEGGVGGTTCARVGCMPSKIFIEAANSYYKSLSLNKMGFVGELGLTPDTKKIMSYLRKLRDRFVRSIYNDIESWETNHLIRSYAKLISPNTIQVDQETIEAKRIILATGSSPVLPQEWMHARDYLVTTDEFFEMEDLPKKMAVIGTGVIGLELGQALARLGIETILIGRGPTLGGLTDPDIIQYATDKISEEVPIMYAEIKELKVENNKLKILCDGKTFEVDKALVAIGRKPNVEKLGLRELGIEFKHEIPELRCGTYRIPNTPIYLVGDADASRPILHEASDEGRIAGYNSVRDEDQKFQRRLFLSITFTAPNIAIIGKSYKRLQEEKVEFVTGKVLFEGQGRSIIMGEERGMLKIYAEKKSAKILGAELFAPAGEHLAHLIAWVIDCDSTVFDALRKPYYHPVVEEGLRTALRSLIPEVDPKPNEIELLRCEAPPAGS